MASDYICREYNIDTLHQQLVLGFSHLRIRNNSYTSMITMIMEKDLYVLWFLVFYKFYLFCNFRNTGKIIAVL